MEPTPVPAESPSAVKPEPVASAAVAAVVVAAPTVLR